MLYPSRRLYIFALTLAATAAGAANPASVTTGPLIAGLMYAPPAPGTNESVVVTAKVTDDAGVSGVSVTYAVSNETTSATVPALDDGAHGDGSAGDSVFGALLPPQPASAKVTFQLAARDNAGKTTVSACRSYISARPASPEFRAIWADSWDEGFRSTTEAQSLIEACRTSNINTIIPEVRKIGDAYYKSSVEPLANNITGGESFDPLGFLIEQAHDTRNGKHRIQVHPWFVMQRVQKTDRPLHPEHILARHPEYEMVKADGTHTDIRYLDPGHPGAVEHNVAVILDCLAKYDIDGIHLDYIRYPRIPGKLGLQRHERRAVQRSPWTGRHPQRVRPRVECVAARVRDLAAAQDLRQSVANEAPRSSVRLNCQLGRQLRRLLQFRGLQTSASGLGWLARTGSARL